MGREEGEGKRRGKGRRGKGRRGKGRGGKRRAPMTLWHGPPNVLIRPCVYVSIYLSIYLSNSQYGAYMCAALKVLAEYRVLN